jgi:uncharacterized protein DUF6980
MIIIPHKFCCESMLIHLKEQTIKYFPKFREYGIPVYDGGTSFIVMLFCPWCGQQLPSSLRDMWFDLLDEKGIDCGDFDLIPEDMNSDSWWRSNTDID